MMQRFVVNRKDRRSRAAACLLLPLVRRWSPSHEIKVDNYRASMLMFNPSAGAIGDERFSSVSGTKGAGTKFAINVRWHTMMAPRASTLSTSESSTSKAMHLSHENMMVGDLCGTSTASTPMLEVVQAERANQHDVEQCVTTKSAKSWSSVSMVTLEAGLQGAKDNAISKSPKGVLRNGRCQRVARTAESLRMQLAEREQRTVETAPQSASLSVILRACLFLHGRSVVGDDEATIAEDWARSDILARTFNVYAGCDTLVGLADWMDFVGDTRCCDFDTALLVFQTVAVEPAAVTDGNEQTSKIDYAARSEEESTRPDLMERLVELGVYNVRLGRVGFCRLLINLVARRCNGLQGSRCQNGALKVFAQDYVIPAMACMSRGAARASRVRLLRDKDTPSVIKTLRDFLPNLWRLFTLYAQDEHGNTIPAYGKDFPSIAQAAEHLIAGSEFAGLEPMSIDFSSRAARIVSQNPGKHLALAVSEERFIRVCKDLSLTPDVAPVAKARAVFRCARFSRLAAHQAKADLAKSEKSNRYLSRPRRIPGRQQSGAMRVTVAHKRRVLAVATQTAFRLAKKSSKPLATTILASASCTPEKPTSLAMLNMTRFRNGDPGGQICCPNLSFCEFVEVSIRPRVIITSVLTGARRPS